MKDLTGCRFGRLTVIRFAERRKDKYLWLCRCECGNEKVIYSGHLKSGASRSCGCFQKEQSSKRIKKHGQSHTGAYETWKSMMQRCHHQNGSGYHLYGAKGITVCKRWHTFENFHKDMGDRPKGYSIDRIDPAQGYSPDNCRWLSKYENSARISKALRVTYQGITKTIGEWGRDLGLSRKLLYQRIFKLGWSIEMAFNMPPRQGNKVKRHSDSNKSIG